MRPVGTAPCCNTLARLVSLPLPAPTSSRLKRFQRQILRLVGVREHATVTEPLRTGSMELQMPARTWPSPGWLTQRRETTAPPYGLGRQLGTWLDRIVKPYGPIESGCAGTCLHYVTEHPQTGHWHRLCLDTTAPRSTTDCTGVCLGWQAEAAPRGRRSAQLAGPAHSLCARVCAAGQKGVTDCLQ